MNKELLARIEKLEALRAKLEQAIQDIWTACPCLTKDLEPEDECLGNIEWVPECGEGWDDEPTEDIDRSDREEVNHE